MVDLFDFGGDCDKVDFRLGFKSVDIARDVEVEVVFGDFSQASVVAVLVDFSTSGVGFDDFVDIFGAEVILILTLGEFAASVDEEYAFFWRAAFFENQDTSWDTGAVK